MGFTVQDMLDMKLFQKANLLWGKGGIGQEIRGVTIIESPDIVSFYQWWRGPSDRIECISELFPGRVPQLYRGACKEKSKCTCD